MFSVILDTKTSTAYFRNSILYITIKPGSQIDVADAYEHLDSWRQVSSDITHGKNFTMLIDLSGIRSISRDARIYYSRNNDSKLAGIAMLVSSPFTSVLGNFFVGLNRPKTPVRLFNSRRKAEKWLNNLLGNRKKISA